MARNISVTLECFVRKGNKYLMLHRNKNKRIMPDIWMAPGGHREFNEGLFECSRREIFEETGLKIKNLSVKAIGNAFLKDLNQEFFFTFVFADYAGGNLKKNTEDGELKWLTPKQMIKLPNLLSEIHQILPYLFDKKSKIISYKAIYKKGNEMSFFEIEKT